MSEKPKTRIAILGGGVGSLVAAFELTDHPGWKNSFEVTVYQMGWRLGGKGSSGRNVNHHDRIEEHGLHLWFGSYHNAFRVMRRCYQELGRNPKAPLATVDDAFRPYPYLGVMQRLATDPESAPASVESEAQREGVTSRLATDLASPSGWVEFIPPWPLQPGKPGLDRPSTPADPWRLVGKLIELAKYALDDLPLGGAGEESDIPEHTAPPPPRAASDRPSLRTVLGDLAYAAVLVARPILESVPEVARVGLGGPPAGLWRAAHLHLKGAEELCAQGSHHKESIADTLDALRDAIWEQIEDAVETSEAFHRSWVLLDLAVSLVRGIVSDEVLEKGWDTIDDYDFREWIARWGANHLTIDDGLVIGLYDFVFAYEDGEKDRKRLAAGSIMRFMMRMVLEYQGSVAWTMEAGMGDVVFAPLYEVLKRRGVKFRFFHKVTGLSSGVDGGSPIIQSITIKQQVALAEAKDEYHPLRDVKGLPCWPSEPLYEQIKDGEKLRQGWREYNLESSQSRPWLPPKKDLCLIHGRDFDEVVLGISLGALPEICKDILEKEEKMSGEDRRWTNLFANVKTVKTLAMQLWMRPNLAGLGWRLGKPAVVDGYAWPFSTYADLSHLIARESWPNDDLDKRNLPGSVAYFCGALEDELPGALGSLPPDEAVKERAKRWLEDFAVNFWPNARDSNRETQLNCELLVDPTDRRGEQRLDAQFFRANVEPSERYVITTPGSNRYRLHPDPKDAKGSGFRNLYLAGDWTWNPLNTGCVEAATMSGMMAARALSGHPEEIIGETLEAEKRSAREKRAAIEVVGEHKGVVAFLELREDQVKALLPNGFELDRKRGDACDRTAENGKLGADGFCGIILVCGERFDTRMTFPRSLPGSTYRELFIAIPYVKPPDGTCTCGRPGPFLYVPKIYVNSLWVMFGARAWGLSTDNAQIHHKRYSDTYRWRIIAGYEPVVVLESRSKGRVTPLNTFKSYDKVSEIFEQQPLLSSSFGGRVTSCADLDWKLDTALAKPVDVSVRFGGGPLKSALRGLHRAPKIDHSAPDKLGHSVPEPFALVRHGWSLTRPRGCRLFFLARAGETDDGDET